MHLPWHDDIMWRRGGNGEEALCLPWRLEPPHNLLSSSRWPMTAFDAIVEPFVSAVIGVRCLMQDRLNVAAQFVCDGDPRLAKLSDQLCHEALGGLGIAAALDKDVEHVTVGIYCAPQPMLHAVDRNHSVIKMPIVVRPRPVTSDAGGKMRTETIDPKPNCFPADNHATFGKQILDICSAQREPMVSPNCVGDDFTRMTIALQARHCGRYFHKAPCSQISMAEQLGNASRPNERPLRFAAPS